MASPSLIWFRDDLRLADNPALLAAVDRGAPVLAVFVLDEESPGIRPLGAAARWWLHHSLASLRDRLREHGVSIILRRGRADRIVRELVVDSGAAAVFWNRHYGGSERTVDAELKAALRAEGVTVTSFAASLLHEPWTVTTGTGTYYSVFTPFWRTCLALPAPRTPLPQPPHILGDNHTPASDPLDDWNLLPTTPDWAAGLRETWEPGEPAALERLRVFLAQDLPSYEHARDVPAAGCTSLLSPRLRWGEVSPFTVWHEAVAAEGAGDFLSELGWREFAWHTLYHFPGLATRNLRAEFDAFPWPAPDHAHLDAWQRGETGVPLVDAGMRELWHTGFMHNRVRMVVASFLVKNLLINWRHGEEWFWDTLVDADQANNPFNWQWVAGSGADAVPYFRVFNPELQAKKFDPQSHYISQWAADAPTTPLVDLGETRRAALAAYEAIKRTRRA